MFWWVFSVGALITLCGVAEFATSARIGSSEDAALIADGVMGIAGFGIGIVVMLIGFIGIRRAR